MNDRAKGILRAVLGDWGAVTGIALIMAVLGPYDTFVAMKFPTRVIFWLVAALGTTAMVKAVRRGLQLWPLTRHWPGLGLRLLSAVLGSVPAALVLPFFYAALARTDRADFSLVYLYVLLPTAFFSLLISRLSFDWLGAAKGAAVVETAGGSDPSASFVARHIARYAGAALLALEAEDHYLRVHTDRGSELILMRLRDAIAQLTAVPGWQVHRSFWVARDAVKDVQRRGAGFQLTLRNGLIVPVSRTYAGALREAGWSKAAP
jgi:hypothetical protein